MQDRGGGGSLPDPRTLAWLLATQNVVQALPTGRTLGEFLAGALSDIPGVAKAGLCLSAPEGQDCGEICSALAGGYGSEPASGCPRGNPHQFPLDTSEGHYGRLVFEIADEAAFIPSEPFLVNYAGSLALLLENREQRTALEEALRQLGASEKRYRQLFTAMTAGHAVHEILLDSYGTPCDYRFLDVNPAFEKLTGLPADEVVGRRAREVLPDLEATWVERYGEVALTGRAIHFESYNRDLDRHYDVVAYRPEEGQFAVLFADISERTEMEARLRNASEELAALNEELLAQNEELVLHQETLERKNEELAVAQRTAERLLEEQRVLFHGLQESLLDIPAELPGVRFGHLYRSATKEAQIGGDFYDVFEAKNGRVALLIGDVSGHGVEAARLATLVKDTVRAFAHQFRDPHRVLRETNHLLVEKKLRGFVSTFLGFLDPEKGTLVFSSAGHPPPVLAVGKSTILLESTGLPLGVREDARYRDREVPIPAGSVMLLYTDGLTEARRGDLFFGEEGLCGALERLASHPVDVLPSLLLDEALIFAGGQLHDDLALLAVRCRGGPSDIDH